MVIFLLYLVPSFLYSQSIQRFSFSSASGFNTVVAGYSLQSSIGELMVHTNATSSTTTTEGFIQNEQPGVIVSLPKNGPEELKVYPNPVDCFLNIELGSYLSPDFVVEVYDVLGKIQSVKFESIQVNGQQTFVINLSNLKQGFYLIKLYSASKMLNQTFKITKI